MASDHPENGRSDVAPNMTQHDMRQAHNGSPSTTTHDSQSTQQLGPPYGLQAVTAPQSQSTQDTPGLSTTLAVTNLPYRIRWQDLKDLFRRYGTPSRADVFLAPDGRSRGVGMVSMRTRREAETCVNDLNGYEWFGRKIGVKIDETGGHHALAAAAMAGATIWEGVGLSSIDYEAVSPQLQTYPVNVNTTSPYLAQTGTPALFVGNLPFSTQWQDLKDLLRPAGRILRADIALAPDGRSKGWGTAVFATPHEAQCAIETFDGWEVEGRIIKVRWDKFQGSTSQPSPQLPPANLSSPQMMHAGLSPTQTPRPNDYIAIASANQSQASPSWQPQYMGGLRPMQAIATSLPSMTMGTSHSSFGQYVQPQFSQQSSTPPSQTQIPQPGVYTGVLFNPAGGYYQHNYTPQQLHNAQLLPPHVRLPTSTESNFQQPGHGSRNPSEQPHDVYYMQNQ